MTITFKPLNESHFPLLLKWLETQHVKNWWDQDVTYTLSKILPGLPANLGAFDILVGEEPALQQGLGSKAILEFLKLHGNPYPHIFADPDSNNVAAVKCYEKAGFKKLSERDDTGEIWMIWKSEANWDLYYIFEDTVYKG